MSARVSFDEFDYRHPHSEAVVRVATVEFDAEPKSTNAAMVELRKHLPDFGSPYTGKLKGGEVVLPSHRLVSLQLWPTSRTGYDLRCYYEPEAK